MDSALRANSNLQMVVAWMLQQTGFFQRQRKRHAELAPRLEALYGPNWPEMIEPLSAREVTQQVLANAGQEVT
jgi:hypothetical protein